MPRTQVLSSTADDTQTIHGLGISATDTVNDDIDTRLATVSVIDTVSAVILDRLVTFVTGAIGAGDDQAIPVPGIEVGDTIISAVRVIAESAVNTVPVPNFNPDRVVMILEDVVADASVSGIDEVTFTDTTFGPDDGLILTYMDLTRPNANA